MIFLLSLLLYAGLAALLVPVLVLLVQTVVAFPLLRASVPPAGKRPRIVVLVPAHNEESGVAGTIASVLPQLFPNDRLLVIADNCSDKTALVATAAGAEVRERFDAVHRGKGYALDFGVRYLADNPPEVLVIVDADCTLAVGALDRLAGTVRDTGLPVQGLCLMKMPANSGPMKKVAEFAWVVKNMVRPLGFQRLGLPCQLKGTGMAFPWSTISTASLANGHLVEDMKLGIDLARKGAPPQFCPHALLYSSFPESSEGMQTQRTRWEHGHVGMIFSEAPRLLANGLIRRKPQELALALDLCVPPVALLTLLVSTFFVLSLILGLWSGELGPMLLASIVLGALGAAILLAWWRFGREIISAYSLGVAFFYALAKIPIYVRFFINRQVEWVRSKRDTE